MPSTDPGIDLMNDLVILEALEGNKEQQQKLLDYLDSLNSSNPNYTELKTAVLFRFEEESSRNPEAAGLGWFKNKLIPSIEVKKVLDKKSLDAQQRKLFDQVQTKLANAMLNENQEAESWVASLPLDSVEHELVTRLSISSLIEDSGEDDELANTPLCFTPIKEGGRWLDSLRARHSSPGKTIAALSVQTETDEKDDVSSIDATDMSLTHSESDPMLTSSDEERNSPVSVGSLTEAIRYQGFLGDRNRARRSLSMEQANNSLALDEQHEHTSRLINAMNA